MTTWKLKKQKGMHWNNMAGGKCCRLIGIPREDGENCIDIIYKICKLTSTNIKKSKIKIAHILKNGAIIVKFKDRPAGDLLYSNKLKLKDKSIKDFGYRNETSNYIIYLNHCLFTLKIFCSMSETNPEHLAATQL